jgi:hypothetical protein
VSVVRGLRPRHRCEHRGTGWRIRHRSNQPDARILDRHPRKGRDACTIWCY